MFKKILIAAGVIATAFAFQAPAQADVNFSISFGSGYGKSFGHGHAVAPKYYAGHSYVQRKHYGHKKHHGHVAVHKKHHGHVIKHKRPHYQRPHFKKPHYNKAHTYQKPVYYLSNQQIRHRLRARGLYNIRFVDRFNGVAKVVAHNSRGYIGRYRVSTRNGHIMSGRILRYINY